MSPRILNSELIAQYMINKKLLKHRGLRNVSYLALGNAVSQIISLIGAFYIPRILGTEKYGQLNIVTSYVSLFTIFTFSGLNKVLLRECSRNLEKVKDIIEGAIGLKNLFALFAGVISVIIVLFINYEQGTKMYIYIYSLSLLMQGLSSTIDIVYQAFEEMKYIAYMTIGRVCTSVPLSIIAVTLGHGVLTLILIQIGTSIVFLLINYKISRKVVDLNFFRRIIFQGKILKQGFNFSLLEFLNALSGKIDIFMLSILTTPSNVGLYALAYRIIEKGLLLRSSISQSLFPYYAKRYNKGPMQIRTLIEHTSLVLIPAVIIASIILLTSEQVITFVVGNEFLASASLLNVLAFYLILDYSIIPWGLSIQTTNNEKIALQVGFLRASLKITLILYLFSIFGLIGVAYATILTFIVGNVFLITYGSIKLKRQNLIT